jgi:hypothetical protein
MNWFKHDKVVKEISGEQKAREFFEHNYVKVGADHNGDVLQPVGKVGIEWPTYYGTCMYKLTNSFSFQLRKVFSFHSKL